MAGRQFFVHQRRRLTEFSTIVSASVLRQVRLDDVGPQPNAQMFGLESGRCRVLNGTPNSPLNRRWKHANPALLSDSGLISTYRRTIGRGLFEQIAHLLVGGLGKVSIPRADRIERVRRQGADGLVRFVLKFRTYFR